MKNLVIIALLLGCVLLVTASVPQNGRRQRGGHRNRGSDRHNRRGHPRNREKLQRLMHSVNMSKCIKEAADNNKHKGCNVECSNVILWIRCMKPCITKSFSDNGSPVPSSMSALTMHQLRQFNRVRRRCIRETCTTEYDAACDNYLCGNNLHECGRCIFEKADEDSAGDCDCAGEFRNDHDHDHDHDHDDDDDDDDDDDHEE